MVDNRAGSLHHSANMLLTIGIACASYHLNTVGRALQSAQAQTVPCRVILREDTHQRGAGAMRNAILAAVDTPLVSFLDADDWIEPDFAAKMLACYQQGKYVFCDHWRGADVYVTPDCGGYTQGDSWHSINAVVVTEHARHIGGFDATLPAIEDRDFFLRLQASGVCGVRCPYPLVHYTAFGQRSVSFAKHPQSVKISMDVNERSLSEAKRMCSCTDTKAVNNGQIGGQQEGDILVLASSKYNRFQGRLTARWYERPRSVDNYRIWMDPRDAMLDPTLQIVDTYNPKEHAPDVDEIQRMVAEALSA